MPRSRVAKGIRGPIGNVICKLDRISIIGRHPRSFQKADFRLNDGDSQSVDCLFPSKVRYLYLAQMIPLPQDSPRPDHADLTVGNLVARYSVKETTSANVGSAVRAFQVVNRANVPCKGLDPCSPDGKWKA